MIAMARVQAPSNIALIKYMGKTDSTTNVPANPSISMTLDRLCTITEVELVEHGEFRLDWDDAPPSMDGMHLRPMPLREKDRPKMERHFRRVLEHFGAPFEGRWRVRTGNAFPAGAGIASSASGFAALTLGIAAAIGRETATREELSSLSRQGSGSSCRSFDGPWVQWRGEAAHVVESRFEPLSDLVILVEESEKAVGSTEAHQRVLTSARWKGRVERARTRIDLLKQILMTADWQRFSQVAWEEAMDMHELFHTAEPPFTYWKPQTREILAWLDAQGVRTGRNDQGLVRAAVTLDAGPNIHLLVSQTEEQQWLTRLKERFPSHQVLVDRQGAGAQVLSSCRGST